MKNLKTPLVFCLFALCTLFFSCEKEDCMTATVRFTNTSDDAYSLYIDDVFQFQVSGNSFKELDLSEGQHSARVEQVDGFIFFPTILDNSLNVFGCQESEWVFP